MKFNDKSGQKPNNTWDFVTMRYKNPKSIGITAVPRLIRPDLHPIIMVPDTSEAQRRAREVVDPRFGVSVYEKGNGPHYTRTYDAFYDWIRCLRLDGKKIDHELINCLIGHFQFANARPHGPANSEGMVPHMLFMPGCRAELLQSQMADELGCSEEKIRLSIKNLRIFQIIVNYGHGWYELSADFFWRGSEALRIAYLPVQKELIRTELV